MGYAAARGGLKAIEAAERLVARERVLGDSPWLESKQMIEKLRLAVDRVMGEGGLWDEHLAASALRQAEGDPIEAAHLLRSYRSTLPRLAYTTPVDVDDLVVLRRIVPAFLEESATTTNGFGDDSEREGDRRPRRLLDLLRDLDAVVDRRRVDDPEPFDITRHPARPPASRSARLATMARAETGALVNVWYRNILGPDGYLHEITLGEVRHGRLPVTVVHPLTGDEISIGEVRVTEVEAIEDLNGIDEDRGRFDVGYGLCFGHNEKKAIAMANLDIACERDRGRSFLEQSILLTTDGLDASGFLEHLKLPHYVTFRSMMERKAAIRQHQEHS